jgi:hypothetical protein
VAEREHENREVVGARIELELASKLLRGRVEAADDNLLLVRWDSGGVTTLRRKGVESQIMGHYGVSAFEVATD